MTDWLKDDIFSDVEDKWLAEKTYTSPEKTDGRLSFIHGEILEARYIRIENHAAGHTMADIGETFMEHLMMLQQMRYENPTAAAKYAKDTLKFMDFGSIKGGATDLHNLASIIPTADVYIHSHTHAPITFKDSYVITDTRNKGVSIQHRLFVNTNAYEGFGGYGEVIGLAPSNHDMIKIELSYNWKSKICRATL